LDSIENAVEEDCQQMYDTNVLGLMRVTKALIPALEAANPGHVVNIGSIAGREAYPGGAGYNAAKFAVKAITQVMRMEWLGRPIRVTEVAPGMVETEFSVVRFKGDEERASKVYSGLTPLTAADVADAVVWAVTRPAHVNIDEIVMKPLAQASATMVSRT
jgi:NADP-dependent 3-hydroxy acid dehydrogenase YdfG